MRSSASASALLAALAALVLVTVVAIAALAPRQGEPSAVASPSPTAPAETVAGSTATPATTPAATSPGTSARAYQSPLGYSVDLPSGWRRSDIQSHTAPVPNGDPENLASDVYTIRSPEDERDAMAKSVDMTGPGPVHSYTAWVRIYKNSEGQTTREFAEDQGHGFGLPVESVEDITFADRGRTSGGRPATRVTWRWPDRGTSFATYVEDDQGRMWAIGFYLAFAEAEVPEGATREDLLKIVGTFSASWLR